MPNIGPLEIALVLVILLVIFGPKRIPQLGRSLGRGIKELKDSLTGGFDDDEDKPKQLDEGSEREKEEQKK